MHGLQITFQQVAQCINEKMHQKYALLPAERERERRKSASVAVRQTVVGSSDASPEVREATPLPLCHQRIYYPAKRPGKRLIADLLVWMMTRRI